MLDLLRYLVLPAVALLGGAGLTARRGKPEAAAVVLGFLTAVALFLLAYLASSTTEPQQCSDCSEVWGRWWEPGLVIFWLGLLLFAWVGLVAAASALFRRRTRR